jgi:hypothetical protein
MCCITQNDIDGVKAAANSKQLRISPHIHVTAAAGPERMDPKSDTAVSIVPIHFNHGNRDFYGAIGKA